MALIQQVKDLRDDRHLTTHGVFIGKQNEFLHFAKLCLDITDRRLFNIFQFPLNDLNGVGKKMQALATDITTFSYRLHENFDT